MKSISLNGIWDITGKPQETVGEEIRLKGEVPGCVQLELSREGFLPKDLYLGKNIKATEEYEDWEWWYRRTFIAPEEKERVFLVFEGVDCLAEYFLNGKKIGESDNMFIAHEFEIGEYLEDGENELTVHLSSVVLAAHKKDYDICASVFILGGGSSNAVRTGIRNTPHSYGWDIMPRAVTVGLWRDVKIEVRDPITFSQIYFQTDAKSCTFFYELECKYEELKDKVVEIEALGSCGEDSQFYQRKRIGRDKCGKVALQIENPKAWYPYGYGEANVYDGIVNIYSQGKCIHTRKISFGLRKVELDRTDVTDGKNGKFRFLINDTEIMCKGSNWVPLDAFHSRDKERYERALALVKDIGCNILRCWGGNVYEDHEFFDFCDRNGIMIWQDFAMACSHYPQTEEFIQNIKKEVVSVIRKLRCHPSIVLWAGDNEDDLTYSYLGGDPISNVISREIIPPLVRNNDPGRPYLPSSPYIDSSVAGGNSALQESENHLWGPRDYYKSDFYKQSKAHFASEMGYMGCPSLESIQKFITPEKVWPYVNNSEWILHSSDQVGEPCRVMLMEHQVRQLFGEIPTEPEEYVLASQISQAEAKKYFIERMRVGRPEKSGIIWWNLLDGWPQMSDAVVDYYFTPKLAYSYIKRSQAPFILAAGEINEWHLPIYACNDTLEEKRGHYIISDAETDEVLSENDFVAAANTTTVLTGLYTYFSEHKILKLEWEINGQKGFNHYLCGYPPFSLEHYKQIMQKLHMIDKEKAKERIE